MKKIVVCLIGLALAFSAGFAGAEDARIPQQMQDEFQQLTGTKANYFTWFPVAPELSESRWSNILILSNFYEDPVTVGCWFTSLSREQTYKTWQLGQYEKMIKTLSELGFSEDVYDVFCMSDQLFGAAILFLEGGKIVTAWPPVF
ncbi:MAG: hypothetical protein SWC40_12245 [Thermodesulfobacteriota bacterium]|nr:hypothetical protein [Thermodesulfobacteriota bacterium]